MKTATEAYKDKRIEMGAGNEAIVPNDFFKARKIHRNLDHLDQILKDEKVMNKEF